MKQYVSLVYALPSTSVSDPNHGGSFHSGSCVRWMLSCPAKGTVINVEEVDFPILAGNVLDKLLHGRFEVSWRGCPMRRAADPGVRLDANRPFRALPLWQIQLPLAVWVHDQRIMLRFQAWWWDDINLGEGQAVAHSQQHKAFELILQGNRALLHRVAVGVHILVECGERWKRGDARTAQQNLEFGVT